MKAVTLLILVIISFWTFRASAQNNCNIGCRVTYGANSGTNTGGAMVWSEVTGGLITRIDTNNYDHDINGILHSIADAFPNAYVLSGTPGSQYREWLSDALRNGPGDGDNPGGSSGGTDANAGFMIGGSGPGCFALQIGGYGCQTDNQNEMGW